MRYEKAVTYVNSKNNDKEFGPFKKLIQIMMDDPLINEKIIKLLRMDSFHRRAVLNSWLEQLRTRKASEDLLQALSSLFDDKTAEHVLALINGRKF